MAIIEATGLTKRYGRVTAVDGLSFAVEAGQVVGFLGPNGAGKTTALRMLLGLIRPDSGTATINGREYANIPSPAAEVGAVFEAATFHPGRTARNHLRVQALAAEADAARIDDVLALVELSSVADKRIGALWLGMRQRLGLATALLADPRRGGAGSRLGHHRQPRPAGNTGACRSAHSERWARRRPPGPYRR